MKFLENVLEFTGTVTEKWRQDAETRRELNDKDPVAEAFDLCADKLEGHLLAAREHFETVTPEEYASVLGVSPTTVRSYIKRGELEAYSNGRGGWRIPAGAVRVQRSA